MIKTEGYDNSKRDDLTRPVEFTLEELWVLHDHIRHEGSEKEWKFPPYSLDLNNQIVLALLACESYKLDSYTLSLSHGDLLVIDYLIRRSVRTPEGVTGKQILLKVFKAREELLNPDIKIVEDGEDKKFTREIKLRLEEFYADESTSKDSN